MSRTALAALTLAFGCQTNAVLELQVELPAAPPDDGTGLPWYGVVQIRAARDYPLEEQWTVDGDRAMRLGSTPAWDCTSVVSDGEEDVVGGDALASRDVHVRVSFCRDPQCLDLEQDLVPRERIYRLEHPFYLGRRTYWRTRIAAIPECASDGDCEGVGVCMAGVCACASSADCPAGLSCLAGNCLDTVERCAIEGCFEGSAASFCDEEGRHYCETRGHLERPESFACD